MAAIYLRHPVHGAKVATMEAEAAYDESIGWVRYDPTVMITPVAEPAPIVNAMVAPTEDPAPPIRRRRARQE
jgi:hypothetical protein